MGRGPVGAPAIIRYVDNSLNLVTDVSGSDGSLTLIKTATASSDSTIVFVNGSNDVVLDDTYPIYKFMFFNIHPQTDNKNFQVNFSVDTGSNYNVSKTTTWFRPNHSENDTYTGLNYVAGYDHANATGDLILSQGDGNQNDESCSGQLWLFNPSSTTFVKHFMSEVNQKAKFPESITTFTAGYCNTTSAVDALQFQYSSGNIDAGTIKLYGIKDS